MRSHDEKTLSAILKYVEDYANRNRGRTPSINTISRTMEISKATAYRYLLDLSSRGKIIYNGRGTLKSIPYDESDGARVGVVGQIVCGTPTEEEEHVERYVSVPKEWVQGECFLLRAYGDSMIDIGIAKGDLVLVQKTTEATDGQVIVALTEEGNTLKRLFWEDGRPRLHAENSSYSPEERDFYPSELTIQGVVLKVIKDVR